MTAFDLSKPSTNCQRANVNLVIVYSKYYIMKYCKSSMVNKRRQFTTRINAGVLLPKVYRKTFDNFEHEFYKSLGFPPVSGKYGTDLIIRITLDDMSLLDGFFMDLPLEAELLSIEQAIKKYIICETVEERLDLNEKLSTFPNPDLSDMLDVLTHIYTSENVSIQHYINNGETDAQPDDPLYLHEQFQVTDNQIYKLIDIVLEVQNNVNSFYLLTESQKKIMLEDFRQVFFLYTMDKFGYRPDPDNIRTLEVLRKLSSEDIGLIQINVDDWSNPAISYKGYDLLNSIIDEVEFYIENYDVFGDVYVKGFREIIFNIGYGDNLIVPVIIREGIDPYRAIFLSALYLGNMDEVLSSLDRLFSEELFNELFRLIPTSKTEKDIGSELLDTIITEGKNKVSDQSLSEERSKLTENIKKRMSLL